MNTKEEVVIAYLDAVENENEILNTGDEFPSFFGGHPIFLNKLTDQNQLPVCKRCGKILKFLLQIYSPLDHTYAMYRCMYVFFCQSKQCLRNQSSVRVFRMQNEQLTQPQINNEFQDLRFSQENLMLITPDVIPVKDFIHQLKEAKQLLPKEKKQNQQKSQKRRGNDDDDDEEELDSEEQESDSCQESSSSDDDYPQKMEKNQPQSKLLERYLEENKNKSKVEQAIEISELADYEKNNASNIDGKFLIYQHFVTEYENHAIRYCFNKNTEPLWFSDKQNFTQKEIAQCPLCKSDRQYEFQINNSILQFNRELYSLEWGAIFVYSCSKSCKNEQNLCEEYIMIQYDDHEEQFSDVSFESQQLQPQVTQVTKVEPKKNKNKKKKYKQIEEKKKNEQAIVGEKEEKKDLLEENDW